MNRNWRGNRPDWIAILVLVLLWAGFFWRFITPVVADRVSLAEGDFSAQFVAFGGYQAARLWDGEVPLWNPYNNGGLPFLADTQAAVFYPPRLVTVALTGLTRQWTYHALELEMMAHVLLTSLLMYWFLRRLTVEGTGSVVGSLVGALTWAYGGFMTGYPPLQLALLEAVSWGPLLLLGIHAATDDERVRWPWLFVSAVALGLSALAGHPQTVWFLALLYLAYLAYRMWQRGWSWAVFVLGAALIGLLAIGLAFVQLLPAAEYLQHTTRIDFGFEAKNNGFPVQDILQIIFPRVLSVWSPLYVGVVGIALAGLAVWQRVRDWPFWIGAALFGVLYGFGGNAALYGLLYNVLPGATLFRGQERGAIVVALALSVLAGLGMAQLASRSVPRRGLRRGLAGLALVTGFAALVAFVMWLGPARELYNGTFSPLAFSALIAGLAFFLLPWLAGDGRSRVGVGLVIALVVFDLFSVAGDSLLTDPVLPESRLERPAVLDVALADDVVPPSRVDGFRGVMGNNGSLWAIPDIRGISPLWLQGAYSLVGQEFPNPLAWELFAVRYVFTDWSELPVPSTIVGTGSDALGPINAHELEAPRPFALLMDDVWLVGSDAEAYQVLASPAFWPRQTVILNAADQAVLPAGLEASGSVMVTDFAPERIGMQLEDIADPVVLSLALPHYPGWKAQIDGVAVPILRAYGALSALSVPAGAHAIVLRYDPWTFKLGAIVSIAAWGGVLVAGAWILVRRRRVRND